MRPLVESDFRPAGGSLGLALLRSAGPCDELRIESEVLEVRPSKSHPGLGLIKLRTTTLNSEKSEPS
jgi:acyl dehydratase